MSLAPRAPIARLARTWLSAPAAVALLLAALAGPAVANEGPTRLVDPSVSPRAGEPTTTTTFSVTYRNREGSEPDYVRVAIDGTNHAMSPTSTSTDYKAGVPFTFATTLPVGEHAISFNAMDRDRFIAEASGGTVTISEPSSGGSGSGPGSGSGDSGAGTSTGGPGPGTATSGSDAGATTDAGTTTGSDSTTESGSGGSGTSPSGSGSGATTDSGSGSGTGSDASGSSGGTAGSGSDSTTGQDGSGSSGTPPGAAAEALDAPSGTDSASGTGSASLSPTDPSAAGSSGGIDGMIGVDPRDGHDGIPEAIAAGGTLDTATGGPGGPGPGGPGPGRSRTGGPFASSTGLEILGVGASPFDRTFRAVPVMITTTGTVVAWAAFLMFGKKRRDGDPTAPDPVLAARAAAGMVTSSASLIPQPSVQPELPMGVDPNEAGMPRWRRPSLLEARKNDPLRNASVAMSLTFAHGAVGPVEGKERRRIRYRLVRLMDTPDEVRANEIGILDEGDEVQLLEKSGTYWLVLCPDGRQGWLHKMVLGEVIDDEDAQLQLNPDGIDEDVLSAFLAIRDRTA